MANFASLQPKDIEWSVKDLLISNRLNLIAGDGGVGKTTFITYLAAQYSTGGEWDDYPIPKCRVGWLTAEEEVSSEVLYRLQVNGTDLNQVEVINHRGIGSGNVLNVVGNEEDREQLSKEVKEAKIDVLMVDVLISFAGSADTNSAADSRALMTLWNKFAIDTSMTIVGVVHLNKSRSGNMLLDITGSAQMGAAVRSVVGIEKDNITGLRYVSVLKNNFISLDTSNTILKYEYVAAEGSTHTWGKVSIEARHSSISADDIRNSNSQKVKDAMNVSGFELEFTDEEIVENIVGMLTTTPKLQYKHLVEGLLVMCKRKNKKKVGDSKLIKIRKHLLDTGALTFIKKGRDVYYSLYSLPLVIVIPTQTVTIGGQTSICRSSAKPTQTTEG